MRVLRLVQGRWMMPCQYNNPKCHQSTALDLALGVSPLQELAGYHRYSASWIAAGNKAGIHNREGLQKALRAQALAEQQLQPQQKQTPCPAPKPCPAIKPCPAAMPAGGSKAAAAAQPAGEVALQPLLQQPGGKVAGAPLRPLKFRLGLPLLLEAEGLQTGAELGVQVGGLCI